MAAIGGRVDGEAAARALIKRGDVTQDGITKALQASGLLIEAQARTLVPQDTRALMNSIHSKLNGPLAVRVAPSLRYGAYVEWGRPPGTFPPIAAITPWARRHGIPPFLVARAIFRRGVKPKPYMRPALARAFPEMFAIFQKLGLKISRGR